MAEQSAWNFVKEKNAHFDLISINPPLVIGPLLNPRSTNLNTSCKLINDYLNGKSPIALGMSTCTLKIHLSNRRERTISVLVQLKMERGGRGGRREATERDWRDKERALL